MTTPASEPSDKHRAAAREIVIDASNVRYGTAIPLEEIVVAVLERHFPAREPGERERAALRALVEKLDAMHEDGSWKSVWTMFSIHGGKYVGPHYDKELAAARAILTESAAPRERKRLRPQEYVVNEETIPELLTESAAPVAGGEDVERLKTSIMAIGIRLWRAARERGENASDLYELADELRALATPAEQRRE